MDKEIKHTTFGKIYFKIKELTSFMRLRPTYLIIGTQKGGTTSLYNYLINHPKIYPALHKEIHYFDLYFKKPIHWYIAHFPIDSNKINISCNENRFKITGEATPYYLFHPLVPQRVAEIFPEMKLICMLRNPIDRAYSHFNHNKRKGREKRDFQKAIHMEMESMPEITEKILKKYLYYSYEHRHYSYLTRGIYIDQLNRWFMKFEKKNILIIKSEDFFNNTIEVMNKIFLFLGIDKYHIMNYKPFNKQKYESEMNQKIRQQLYEFYRPHNEKLYESLGTDFKWK